MCAAPKYVSNKKLQAERSAPTPIRRYASKATQDALFEEMVTDWAVNHASESVRAYLVTGHGYTQKHYEYFLGLYPASLWESRRRAVVQRSMEGILGRHIARVAEIHDQHMAAASLALAKAVEFMTKMKVEERIDRHGRSYFVGFKSTDLKNCADTIATAQKVMRMALGLPTDEGSIQACKQANRMADLQTGSDPTVTEQVEALQKTLTYDDIYALLTLHRQGQLRPVCDNPPRS